MSVFTLLPQDMLQYEISRFLDPLSRAEFNAVLKPDERIFNKLSTDYALKHHIRTMKSAYEVIAIKLNYYMEFMDESGPAGRRAVRRVKKALMDLFILFTNPMFSAPIMFQLGLKEKLIEAMQSWREDDQDLYTYIGEDEQAEIFKVAEATQKLIEAIPFVRHVKV
jgi:hypothetical protein